MKNKILEGGLPRDNEKPDECVARLKGAAEIAHTPCGKGTVVWHIWGDGDPLLLLHGNHGSWTHWIKNIPFFSERYRVFVPDALGWGLFSASKASFYGRGCCYNELGFEPLDR